MRSINTKSLTISLSILSAFFSNDSLSAQSGNISQGPIQDQATVCLNIAARAFIVGLNDFSLTTTDISGNAGSVYQGSTTFFLESNSPVRIQFENGTLSNQESIVPVSYTIDGSASNFDTASTGSHSGEHTLAAKVELARISSQIAGDYAGTVTLTVVPQFNDLGGTCGGAIPTPLPIDGNSSEETELDSDSIPLSTDFEPLLEQALDITNFPQGPINSNGLGQGRWDAWLQWFEQWKTRQGL